MKNDGVNLNIKCCVNTVHLSYLKPYVVTDEVGVGKISYEIHEKSLC